MLQYADKFKYFPIRNLCLLVLSLAFFAPLRLHQIICFHEKNTIVFFICLRLQSLQAQEFIPLWTKGKMPNSKGMNLKDSIANERIYQVGTPGMYAYFPSQQENRGAAVVICPGGGYERLAYIISGAQLANGLIR